MTTFHTPRNNAATTVAVARAAGAPTIDVADGSAFGAAFPLIATAFRGNAVLAILEVTGRSGNTLTVSGAIEGTTDPALLVGDRIEMRPTALAITEVQDAVHALEASTVYSTASYADPAWIASLAGAKIGGDIAGNAATATAARVVAGTTFSAMDNTDVRVIDSPCTTAGKAAMGVSVAGADFGGIGDPLVAFGYNLRASGGAIDTTEVAWGLKFEGDYLEQATGKRLSEGYIEFWPIGSTTSIRPWFIRMDRTQTDPTKALDTALYYGNPFLIGHPDGTLLAQIGKGETALFAGLSGASNTFKIAAAAGQGAVINLQYDGVDNAFQARTEAGSTALQSVNNFQVTAGSGGNVAVNLSGGGALVVNGGAIQVVFGAASGYIRHAATVLFQVGPGSATTTRADIGMGAINPALGSTVQTKADGSIAFVGINGTDSGSIDPTGTMTAANGLKLPTFADASAPDGSIFFGSDHLDGSSKAQLCRKQGGTVTVIG